MASTEAQKRASAKYQRLHTKQVNLGLYEWIQAQEGAASTYIKALVLADMERNKLD